MPWNPVVPSCTRRSSMVDRQHGRARPSAGRSPRRLLAVALTVAAISAVSPTPSAAAPPVRAVVTEALTEAAALETAQTTGGRVEVLSARTEWSQTFALPSGTMVMEQYMQPQ